MQGGDYFTLTNEPYFHIGELDKGVKLVAQCIDEEIRDIEDYQIDFAGLIAKLKQYKEKVKSIQYVIDDRFAKKSLIVNELERLGVELHEIKF